MLAIRTHPFFGKGDSSDVMGEMLQGLFLVWKRETVALCLESPCTFGRIFGELGQGSRLQQSMN